MWARRRRRWTTRPVLPVGFEPTVSALSERRALRCSAGVAAAAGIEPAIVWLTASRLTIRPHRKKRGTDWQSVLRVGMLGFEPRLSWIRTRRISQAFPHPVKSTQRDLNPHTLPGEQGGCHYLMDAYQRKRPGVAVTPGLSSIQCQKDPMSTALRASGRHICRLTDHPTRPLTDPQGIRPTSKHCFL
jgi:hypothetical protein